MPYHLMQVTSLIWDDIKDWSLELISGVLVAVIGGVLVKNGVTKKKENKPSPDEFCAPEGYVAIEAPKPKATVIAKAEVSKSEKIADISIPPPPTTIRINDKFFNIQEKDRFLNCVNVLVLDDNYDIRKLPYPNVLIYYRNPIVGSEPEDLPKGALVKAKEGQAFLIINSLQQLHSAVVKALLPVIIVNYKPYVVYNTNTDTHGSIYLESILRLHLGLHDKGTPAPLDYTVTYEFVSNENQNSIKGKMNPKTPVRLIEGMTFTVKRNAEFT
jgi:hypothetical protein